MFVCISSISFHLFIVACMYLHLDSITQPLCLDLCWLTYYHCYWAAISDFVLLGFFHIHSQPINQLMFGRLPDHAKTRPAPTLFLSSVGGLGGNETKPPVELYLILGLYMQWSRREQEDLNWRERKIEDHIQSSWDEGESWYDLLNYFDIGKEGLVTWKIEASWIVKELCFESIQDHTVYSGPISSEGGIGQKSGKPFLNEAEPLIQTCWQWL